MEWPDIGDFMNSKLIYVVNSRRKPWLRAGLSVSCLRGRRGRGPGTHLRGHRAGAGPLQLTLVLVAGAGFAAASGVVK